MGMYINGNLMNGERVNVTFEWHWSYFFWPIVFSFFIIGIPVLIYRIINSKTSEMAITDRRLIGKTGIIARNTVDASLDQISSIQIDQGLLQRILNAGYIRYNLDGQSITVPIAVNSPIKLRNQFSEVQHNYKSNLYAGKTKET